MTAATTGRITTFAQAEEVLAQALPGYESRPQQQRMAQAVEQTLATDSGMALIEAGCGVGKSLGALIPAILSGKRTVITTATLALMSQIAEKDVPFLQDNLPVPFTWALLKGRSNYLCRAKMMDVAAEKYPELVTQLRAELDANPDHSGSFDDFQTPIDKAQQRALAMSSTECPGKSKCPFGDTCFAEKAKTKAKEAQVVVTNAAMLMTDVKVRRMTDGVASMLGAWDALIVDEAHSLGDIATSQLSEEFSEASTGYLIQDINAFASSQETHLDTGPLQRAAEAAWDQLPELRKSGDRARLGQAYFVERVDQYAAITEALNELLLAVQSVTVGQDTKAQNARQRLTSRIANMATKYVDLVAESDDRVVRWVEAEWNERARRSFKVLHLAPIDVGPVLQEYLWSQAPSVLVSATLSTNGTFDYAKRTLGAYSASTLDVGTPFDYDSQALLFVPDRTVASPKDRLGWSTYVGIATMEMIKASGGGALLLYTSRTAMEDAYRELGPRLEEQGLTVLAQGVSGSNKAVAAQFKSDTNSVLFALRTFFTGIDIPGDSLRLVIIDKLPFPVPTEPIFQARGDLIKRLGGSDFTDLSVPMMTLDLVQAYGRLIRTKSDRGVVAILDSRLSSTGWGRKIVASLPDSPATTSLADVRGFFARG